jgi:thymidylate kinase
MKEIAIEGLDGTGKTTIAHELAELYEHEGVLVVVSSPFAEAKKVHGGEFYHLWKDDSGALYCIHLLKDRIQHQREKAAESSADVLIYDRHWMTAFSEISTRPRLVQAWGDNFVPTAYLRTTPDVGRQRAHGDHAQQWMEEPEYKRYSSIYEALCREYGHHILGVYRNDRDVTPSQIATNIQWDMQIRR